MAMKRVRLEYYAYFREKAGKSSEEVETAAEDLAALYTETAQRHGFRLPLANVRVVVGEDFVEMRGPVEHGASIAFVPPVAGG